MSMRLRVAITVDAPIDVVWAELADLGSHSEWMADAVAIRFIGSQRSGVGTRMEVPTRVGPMRTTDELVVTEWQPRRALAVEHRGAISGAGRFTLRRKRRGRTRVEWRERVRFPWWLGGLVGEQAARPVLRRIWRRNLARLGARVSQTT